MPTPSSWLFDSGYHALLLGGVAAAALLAWFAWRRDPSPSGHYVWLGALCVLASAVLSVPFAALANARQIAPALWVGPLDRLLAVTMLVMLGWTVVKASRTWRVFLASGFAAAAVTYLSWAPAWAQELVVRPSAIGGGTAPVLGLAHVWDGLLVLLAMTVAGGMVRTTPRVPRWLLAAVAAVGAGAALEVMDASFAFPAWSRLGTLAAGACFVAAAVLQFVERRHGAHDVSEPLERLDLRAIAVAEGDDLSLDSVATQALFEAVGRLSAEPALFCLVSEDGELTVWGVARRGEGSRRLGELPLSAHPTVAKALGAGLSLRTNQLAADVSQLYGLMGIHTDGPVLLQPVRATSSRGVLIVGRRAGRWHEADHAALAALAGRAARRLDALDAPTAEDQIEHVFDVIETQTESVTRLARIVEGLSERLGSLETVRPADSALAVDADLDGRVLQYEMALEALPWGILVCDAEGCLIFGNGASWRLLALEGVRPGQPAGELFPDAERIGVALERCARRAGQSGAPVEALFDSPALRVELEPLHDAKHGYLGAVAVIRPRAADDLGVEAEVMVALAEALRSPITCILGYSNLLSHGTGLSQDQLDRYLQRIDANLARMQVHLENLVTVMEMGGDRHHLHPVGVDSKAALTRAADRARVQMDEKALVLSTSALDELPPLAADPAALDQILDNLLANAAIRSPQGGDVGATAEHRVDAASQAIVISVTDRGQPLLGSGTHELTEASVTGVGLTVVRMLAEHLGGKAWAESGPSGTTFLVRLPLLRVLSSAPEAGEPPEFDGEEGNLQLPLSD